MISFLATIFYVLMPYMLIISTDKWAQKNGG